MKSAFAVTCCLALAAVLGFSQTKHEKHAQATTMTDQQFIDQAAQSDMLEAHLGQMAADQAAGVNVKNYAETLVTDPTKDYQQLTEIAAKDNFTVPKGVDAEGDRVIEPFDKLKGDAFDNRYLHETIESDMKTLELYTRESKDAQNSDVRNYASAALPALNKQLDSAKDLEKQLAKK